MAGVKSEKEARLNYTIQPFAKLFFDAISSVQLLAESDSQLFFSLKPFCRSGNLSVVY
jgi:hypothetical protein